MRKNTVLAAAITTALSINVVYAGTLENWPTDATCVPCTTAPAPANSAYSVIKTDKDKGINFGTHLFGSNAVVLPANDYFAVKYQLQGAVDFAFEFKATLSNGAQFSNDAILQFVSASGNTDITETNPNANSSCNDQSVCQWSITPDNGTTSKKLMDGDTFFVFYKITNVQALANAGEKITFTAQLGTTFTPALIDTREVTIANGAEPLNVVFEPATDTGARISVASQNTEFTSRTSGSTEISAQTATMGYLQVEELGDSLIMSSNGHTPWDLGNTNTADGGSAFFSAEFNSTDNIDTSLTISGGQFAASVTGSTGKVSLELLTECSAASADLNGSGSIEADLVDETNATWQLSDSELQDIMQVSKTCNTAMIPIVIKSDGTTGINTVENPPTAAFTLDYTDQNNLQDIQYGPTELSKFKADGTICWIYNVPGSAAADTLALRVTNDSTSAGTIMGTLYDKDGAQIFPAEEGSPPLNLLGPEVELAAGATKAIFSTTLENLEGGPYTWAGRGVLQISSTLSRLEVLTLIRSSGGIATNLSVGASGAACDR